MTQHITTGPHPGHTGACMAQYNHNTLNHSNFSNPNHVYPYIQQPFIGQAPYGTPPRQPAGASTPFWY